MIYYSKIFIRNIMTHVHKSYDYDLQDMLNDTPRYIDDIFTIGNP